MDNVLNDVSSFKPFLLLYYTILFIFAPETVILLKLSPFTQYDDLNVQKINMFAVYTETHPFEEQNRVGVSLE